MRPVTLHHCDTVTSAAGLLGREHDDPPAFPRAEPNMTFIDQPAGHGLRSPGGRFNYYTQAAYVPPFAGRPWRC